MFRFITLIMVWTVTGTYAQELHLPGLPIRWSGTSPQYWSVKNKTIIGYSSEKVPRNEFLWSDIEVSDFYLSVNVMLNPNDCNAGIQFRSRKADSTGQAIGYQADVGAEVWGRLYHEHGRGKLDWSDRGEKAVRPGKWNHYEILAVGDRIWTAINGQLAVAIRDPNGEKRGHLALQIHSGPSQTVKYKIRKLVHNPPVKLVGLDEQQLNSVLKPPLISVAQEEKREALLHNEKIIAMVGGTNIAAMRSDCYLETLLYITTPQKEFRVWNLGWDGDTVYEQFRDVGFGSWDKNLDSLGTDALILQFGQMEALKGQAYLSQFIEHYREIITKAKKMGQKIILLSPTPFESERLISASGLQNPLREVNTSAYADAIEHLAKETGCGYIDLLTPLSKHPSSGTLTRDGIHLNQEGQKLSAEIVASKLRGVYLGWKSEYEGLRREVVEKNYLWISYWRPGNWAFLYGDRTSQPFSHDWKDRSKRIFPEEVKRFEPMILEAEQKIADLREKIRWVK